MIDLDVLSSAEVAADRAAEGQPRFWRSASDFQGTQAHRALQKDEFHPAATDASDIEGDPGPSRRSFMKIMGASLAMAGLTGCRRPVEHVLPYSRKPEDIVPGIPNYYATAMPSSGGFVQPLVVESNEGRPTGIGGNPEHPYSLGGTDVFAQASILNLYDPDRSRRARLREGGDVAWSDFVRLARRLGSQRVAVLAEPTSSPTVRRLRDQLAGTAEWITYRNTGDDPAALGLQGVAGRPLRPLYRFSEAQTIVSFDADFLSGDNSVYNSREYAFSRRVMEPTDDMSRLYVAESAYTQTGGMADHRRRMKAGMVPFFAAAVAARLGLGGVAAADEDRYADDPFLDAVVEDAQAGTTIFVAGATQPAAVHALCARLNDRFAAGAVQYLDTGEETAARQGPALRRLVRDMRRGAIDVLVMIGVNPVYDAPPELGFADALARVPTSIHLGTHLDETAAAASWHIPRAHYLEQWGDGRAYDGTYSVIQPLIAPLYEDARSEVELLHTLATGEEVSAYDLVRATIRQQGLFDGAQGTFEDAWRTLLHDGFLPETQYAAQSGAAAGAAGTLERLTVPADDAIEVVIRPDPKMLDGTFSNNAWMQEVPDPVTKVTWDAVAQMSAATAQALGIPVVEGSFEGGPVEAGRVMASVISIRVGDREIEVPAWVQPGHPDNSITVTTGYGRTLGTDRVISDRSLLARLFDKDVDIYRPGPLANGIGAKANAARLRGTDGSAVIPAAEVEIASEERYMIATTQDHGSMEGRPLVRMGTLDEYRADPTFAKDAVKPVEGVPWEDFPAAWNLGEDDPKANTPTSDPRIGEAMYSENQWAMVIDLNACSGCNACVVACQSENNIIVVGKDQVARGREMHWVRMDRYYVSERADDPFDTQGLGELDSPMMVMQPMMCQHCEYAPCESVCPVAATVHSPDGLNVMVYNRCIGTRYCSNNCPYKVRRFNFYNWTKTLPVEIQMAMNPNVTMRFRGVMEKCTWCVQRIRAAQTVAHIEDRPLRDGEVRSACESVCAPGAIVFGDLNDPDSRVNQIRRNARRYELLEELNVKPRLSYLARLRNPNPTLEARLHPDPETVQPEPSREPAPEPSA
ncbi:MAG: TAT-variant-translocated molybdopterin oxidoreductase [Bacteroidota bacterium]